MKTIKNILAILGLCALVMTFTFALQDAPSDENFEKKIINDQINCFICLTLSAKLLYLFNYTLITQYSCQIH